MKTLLNKAGLAAFILTLASLSFSPAFASNASDIEGNWAEAQITQWMKNDLISGYPDGEFKPNQHITRAELIALINKSFGFTVTKEMKLTDVSANDWFYPEVLKANAAGYITGYADGSFGPDREVSRQEFAVMISKLLGLIPSESADTFSDMAQSPAWSKEAIGAVYDQGIMTGYAMDRKFHPRLSATRAEAVVILDRTLKVKEKLTSALTPTFTPTPSLAPTPTPVTSPEQEFTATPIVVPPRNSMSPPSLRPEVDGSSGIVIATPKLATLIPTPSQLPPTP
ncbi:S-layer homology domain-containing protein [Paenibacillus sp. sgz500958]|uniref:S-layer homology domain-containing protein n=1 Tax=Paenibacillus sp. sgz500958 TaxID=3242475 RepID=UPI0036D3A877